MFPQKGKASWNRGKKLAWVTNSVEYHQIKIEELSDYLNKDIIGEENLLTKEEFDNLRILI